MPLGKEFNTGLPHSFKEHPKVLYKDLGTGIEIETEGFNNIPNFSLWKVDRDGSLRDGVEFISTVLHGKGVVDALEEVRNPLANSTPSWRCAVHVHIDIRDLEWDQLVSVCTLYAMLEPAIFEWEGNGRETSRFCIPWESNPDPIPRLMELMKDRQEGPRRPRPRRHIADYCKYSALNIAPITYQGTIEFRHMQTSTSIDRILQYVNLCSSIVREGANVPSDELLQLLSEHGPQGFLIDRVGKGVSVLAGVEGVETLLWRGIEIANLINISIKNLDSKRNKIKNIDQLPII